MFLNLQEVKKTWSSLAEAATAGDSTKSEKMRKMLGLRDEPSETEGGGAGGAAAAGDEGVSAMRERQTELFERLEREYQFARAATHSYGHHGLGSFSSAPAPVPAPAAAGPTPTVPGSVVTASAPPAASSAPLSGSFVRATRP